VDRKLKKQCIGGETMFVCNKHLGSIAALLSAMVSQRSSGTAQHNKELAMMGANGALQFFGRKQLCKSC